LCNQTLFMILNYDKWESHSRVWRAAGHKGTDGPNLVGPT